jgi:hypothetical protein
MSKNQQFWLLIIALIALYLWTQKKTPQQIAADATNKANDPKNQLPLSSVGVTADVFQDIVNMQGPAISVGY